MKKMLINIFIIIVFLGFLFVTGFYSIRKLAESNIEIDLEITYRKVYPDINVEKKYKEYFKNDKSLGFSYISSRKDYETIESSYKIDLPEVNFNEQRIFITYNNTIDSLSYYLRDKIIKVLDRDTPHIIYGYIRFSNEEIDGVEVVVVNTTISSWNERY